MDYLRHLTHFGHKNIVKYCDRPEDHNQMMIDNWQRLVMPDDVVLHLGDLAVWYGDLESYWLTEASRLRGHRYLLRGNHDKKKASVYEALGWTLIPEFIQTFDVLGISKRYMTRVLFSHAPDEDRVCEWDVNIHGHIHNNELDPRLAATNRRYINVSVEKMGYQPVRFSDIL